MAKIIPIFRNRGKKGRKNPHKNKKKTPRGVLQRTQAKQGSTNMIEGQNCNGGKKKKKDAIKQHAPTLTKATPPWDGKRKGTRKRGNETTLLQKSSHHVVEGNPIA